MTQHKNTPENNKKTAKRSDPLLSKEQIENLLKCIEIISHHLGTRVSFKNSLNVVAQDKKPSLSHFKKIVKSVGFNVHIENRKLADIPGVALPSILTLKDGGVLILLSWIDEDIAEVVTPELPTEIQRVERGFIETRHTDECIFVHRIGDTHGHEHEELSGKGWFGSVIKRVTPLYVQVLAAAFFINILALANPLFVMNVYDRVVPNHAIETLWVLAIGVIMAFSFDFILKLIRSYYIDIAGRALDIGLTGKIFHQMMNIRMSHKPKSSGIMASSMREFEMLREFFTSATLSVLVDIPFIFLFILIVAFIGGKIAWLLIIVVPIVLIFSLLMQLTLSHTASKAVSENSSKQSLLIEVLHSLEAIKTTNAQNNMQQRWEEASLDSSRTSLKSRFISAIAVHFSALMQQLTVVSVVIWGVYSISVNEMTVGGLVACTILTGRTLMPLGHIASTIARLQQARASYTCLNKLMGTEVERPADKNFLYRPKLNGSIEINNVSFRYPGQKLKALSDLNLKIKSGEKIAIIGRAGAGKTTLIKMLMNLYVPSRGTIMIDGTEISQIDPASLRNNISYVSQDHSLLSGSLRENITIGDPMVDEDSFLKAVKISGVDQFANQHPSGYDMEVGENGNNLSGGQKQAVVVARSLLNDGKIILLDEPSSSMDSQSEAQFLVGLEEFSEHKTLIISTHRLSLLMAVDRIIIMDKGTVITDGPKDLVLKTLRGDSSR